MIAAVYHHIILFILNKCTFFAIVVRLTTQIFSYISVSLFCSFVFMFHKQNDNNNNIMWSFVADQLFFFFLLLYSTGKFILANEMKRMKNNNSEKKNSVYQRWNGFVLFVYAWSFYTQWNAAYIKYTNSCLCTNAKRRETEGECFECEFSTVKFHDWNDWILTICRR